CGSWKARIRAPPKTRHDSTSRATLRGMPEPMPRESRSRNLELFTRLALPFMSAGFFIAGCDGQFAFDSPASGGSAQAAGSSGSGGNNAGNGNNAGSGNNAGAGNSAGAGNTGGGNWLSRGPEACLDD